MARCSFEGEILRCFKIVVVAYLAVNGKAHIIRHIHREDVMKHIKSLYEECTARHQHHSGSYSHHRIASLAPAEFRSKRLFAQQRAYGKEDSGSIYDKHCSYSGYKVAKKLIYLCGVGSHHIEKHIHCYHRFSKQIEQHYLESVVEDEEEQYPEHFPRLARERKQCPEHREWQHNVAHLGEQGHTLSEKEHKIRQRYRQDKNPEYHLLII